MFTGFPAYPRFRTLHLTNPMQRGEDVYALQTALNEAGYNSGTADGILGSRTSAAIHRAQVDLNLLDDGKAGGLTQRALALSLAGRVARVTGVPANAFKGQLELESGYWLGNYSPLRADGTYDAGVCQRNTKFTSPQVGFDASKSIMALGDEVKKHYDLFLGVSGAKRRWALAQGAWNAPAFACYIAREEGATQVTAGMTLKPSAEARATFEEYVANASVYL